MDHTSVCHDICPQSFLQKTITSVDPFSARNSTIDHQRNRAKTANMFLPYQCLEKARGSLLVAARGSTIDLFRTDDSTHIFSWTCPATQTTGNKPASKEEKKDDSTSQPAREDGVPPAKKQKLSPAMDGNPAPVPKDGKKKKNNRAQDVSSGLEAPAVTALAITNSGQHVIAVTGEDKSIRVFKLVSENGSEKLQQISIR